MRHAKKIIFSLISLSCVSSLSHAAAFQLYEMGSPLIGTAMVGQSVASDASTSYYNPAGMSLLPSTQFMLGSQMLLTYNNFTVASNNTIAGNNGGNAGTLLPGMDVYFAYKQSPDLSFGVSVTTPYGGSLTYNDGWVGRFIVQNAFFYTINVNPSVAYRINQQFAIGGGVAAEFMSLQQTTALPLTPLVDGQIDAKVDNISGGFNLGAMYTPSNATKLGLAYRSQIVHNMSGDITFLRIAATPNATLKMVMPQNLIASLSQDLSERFALLAELGWSNWASMKDTILVVDGFSAVTPRNWNNTYRFGLGGKYKATEKTILQAGASYDSSPTTTAKRLPDLPMDSQVRLGLGVLYSINKSAQIGISYEYWNFGSAHIDNTSSNGVLAGHYKRNYADAIQASVNVSV